MKKVNRNNDRAAHAGRAPMPWQRRLSQLIILAMCSVLLMPGVASAKKPVASETGCVIFMDDTVYSNTPFTVKVVRDPSYPDAWRNPTFTIEASFTGSTQTVSATIEPSLANAFSVTYVHATIVVPDDASFAGTATISATVEEPLNKRKTRTTTCSTTASVQ